MVSQKSGSGGVFLYDLCLPFSVARSRYILCSSIRYTRYLTPGICGHDGDWVQGCHDGTC